MELFKKNKKKFIQKDLVSGYLCYLFCSLLGTIQFTYV